MDLTLLKNLLLLSRKRVLLYHADCTQTLWMGLNWCWTKQNAQDLEETMEEQVVEAESHNWRMVQELTAELAELVEGVI